MAGHVGTVKGARPEVDYAGRDPRRIVGQARDPARQVVQRRAKEPARRHVDFGAALAARAKAINDSRLDTSPTPASAGASAPSPPMRSLMIVTSDGARPNPMNEPTTTKEPRQSARNWLGISTAIAVAVMLSV